MSAFERAITKASSEKDIPGAVVVAGNKSGDLKYAKAFGVRSLATSAPMELDSTMWIASCSKLMTTVATLQCVERGLLSLDMDVTTVLPELKDVPVITGFDKENGGKPILVPNTKVITLRHLLTHSSGLGYDFFNPTLMKYQKYVNNTIDGLTGQTRIKDKYVFPLLFEPGEGWEYSVGIDWAGQMVERVNNNITLEAYLSQHVWGPLGIRDVTFKPQDHPNVKEKLVDISWRQGGVNKFGSTDNPTGKVETTTQKYFDPDTPDCHGGHGLFGSVTGYHKFLQSLISDNSPLLKASTIDEMFKPQLSAASRRTLARLRSIPEVNNGFGGLDLDVEADWGLGGIMNTADLRTGRKKGSIAWGGYPNLMWWIDRETGVAGIYGSQICPPGDPLTVKLNALWEAEIYEQVTGAGAKGKL